ncbi:GNAT family N-acetyltransferase [Pararhizobium sp. BT-229]|uniref:GNAT family N-acetyltransferase n=1 Tax=Pararhizobium sp. BT-229 TaxID=2986923 RepID=UPI0021F72BA0|nr:GNAT family N-acetyltransferase [Pararhizobium sp. BT-229]MCV9965576.1 GNAT family N-acetyltransferase [Pararhizobium sp. BT-229]
MIATRHARQDDVPVLVDIGLQAWERAVSGVADARAMRHVAEVAFLSFLRSKWFSVSVVEFEGQVIGWAAREDNDGHISDLWVRPAVQRSGFGSILLAELEARIAAEGFEAAVIKTHAQNAPAIGFFRKHGYTISWLSTAYAPKLDRDVESVGMSKSLEEPVAQSGQQWF